MEDGIQREDVVAMADALREAQDQVANLTVAMSGHLEMIQRLERERDEARAKVDSLEAANARLRERVLDADGRVEWAARYALDHFSDLPHGPRYEEAVRECADASANLAAADTNNREGVGRAAFGSSPAKPAPSPSDRAALSTREGIAWAIAWVRDEQPTECDYEAAGAILALIGGSDD